VLEALTYLLFEIERGDVYYFSGSIGLLCDLLEIILRHFFSYVFDLEVDATFRLETMTIVNNGM
jgi:hypothetical protein